MKLLWIIRLTGLPFLNTKMKAAERTPSPLKQNMVVIMIANAASKLALLKSTPRKNPAMINKPTMRVMAVKKL